MSQNDTFDAYDATSLPSPVAAYMAAQGAEHRREARVELFASDAHVTDAGTDHRGLDGVRAWLDRTSAEYTYTTSPTGQRQDGPNVWTTLAHLEGDFPGGVVDLTFRFELREGRISRLVIAP